MRESFCLPHTILDTQDHIVPKDVIYESDIKSSLSPVATEKKTSNIWNELRPGTAMKREVFPGVWVREEEYCSPLRL